MSLFKIFLIICVNSNLLKLFDCRIRRYCEKMAKLILFIFVALLATSLIMAAPDKSTCGRHGDPVSIYTYLFILLF